MSGNREQPSRDIIAWGWRRSLGEYLLNIVPAEREHLRRLRNPGLTHHQFYASFLTPLLAFAGSWLGYSLISLTHVFFRLLFLASVTSLTLSYAQSYARRIYYLLPMREYSGNGYFSGPLSALVLYLWLCAVLPGWLPIIVTVMAGLCAIYRMAIAFRARIIK